MPTSTDLTGTVNTVDAATLGLVSGNTMAVTLHVNNEACDAAIAPPSISGVEADPCCGVLKYGGKVGTGFKRQDLDMLFKKLAPLKRETPPVAHELGLPRKGVHRVEPKLVAEVGFSEWTQDHRLRHPRFLGLRDDKAAREVVREAPKP